MSDHVRKKVVPLRWKPLASLALVLVSLYIVIIVLRNFNLILSYKNDRVNMVFYGRKTTLLSISKTEDVHYVVIPDNDIYILVPGGYQYYRIGALGRLSKIEKDPDIIHRAFSSLVSADIDYYFLPKKVDIYDWERETADASGIPKLTLFKVLFANEYTTNASFIDRTYLFLKMLNMRRADFIQLKPKILIDSQIAKYSEEGTQKKYAGFFYEESLRKERKNVKISYYRRYRSAINIGRVIEGEGIRVVDISITPIANNNCVLRYSSGASSVTMLALVKKFNCSLEKGTVEGADIEMKLGVNLEEKWK